LKHVEEYNKCIKIKNLFKLVKKRLSLQCGVYAVVVALAFIADDATADN